MENTPLEKRKLKKEIAAISNQLKKLSGLLLCNALTHKIQLAVTSHFKSMSLRHQK